MLEYVSPWYTSLYLVSEWIDTPGIYIDMANKNGGREWRSIISKKNLQANIVI